MHLFAGEWVWLFRCILIVARTLHSNLVLFVFAMFEYTSTHAFDLDPVCSLLPLDT